MEQLSIYQQHYSMLNQVRDNINSISSLNRKIEVLQDIVKRMNIKMESKIEYEEDFRRRKQRVELLLSRNEKLNPEDYHIKIHFKRLSCIPIFTYHLFSSETSISRANFTSEFISKIDHHPFYILKSYQRLLKDVEVIKQSDVNIRKRLKKFPIETTASLSSKISQCNYQHFISTRFHLISSSSYVHTDYNRNQKYFIGVHFRLSFDRNYICDDYNQEKLSVEFVRNHIIGKDVIIPDYYGDDPVLSLLNFLTTMYRKKGYYCLIPKEDIVTNDEKEQCVVKDCSNRKCLAFDCGHLSYCNRCFISNFNLFFKNGKISCPQCQKPTTRIKYVHP
jgi:hypothetical protein